MRYRCESRHVAVRVKNGIEHGNRGNDGDIEMDRWTSGRRQEIERASIRVRMKCLDVKNILVFGRLEFR